MTAEISDVFRIRVNSVLYELIFTNIRTYFSYLLL